MTMAIQISSTACGNIYSIFNELNMFNKLPQEEQQFIKKNKSDNEFNFDKTIPLENQIQDKETKILISYLFLKYINKDVEFEEKLIDTYRRNEIKFKNEMRIKYNPDNIFDKRSKSVEVKGGNSEILQMTEYKESLFTRILKWIKKHL